MAEPADDSKLVRAAERVKGQVAIWALAATTAVAAALIGRWAIHLDEDVAEIRSLLVGFAKEFRDQRDKDLDRLAGEIGPLRDRVAASEVMTHQNQQWIDRNTDRINQMAADVSAIRAQLSRRDRDRADEPPAPPVDLGARVPMLWHF